MGGYTVQGGLWDSRPYYKKADGQEFLYYKSDDSRWMVGATLGSSEVLLQVRDTALYIYTVL
jgi:hypothetical protein